MWLTIAGLIALGIILLVVEVFVPGLVVGICGMLALIAAAVLAYSQYGSGAGDAVVLALVLGGIAFFIWWLRYVPRSFVGRRMTLGTHVPAATFAHSVSIKETGKALTALRPSGIAVFAGHRTDVVTEGEMIPAGEPVEVVRVEGPRIVVRRMSAARV